MTIQQLLENAHLDALGMLDADEQAAFEVAFAAAPPGVKAQVRAEQARWAEAASFLPDVHPSPELRQKVLDAVALAMLETGPQRAEEPYALSASPRVARWWRTAAVGMTCAAALLGAAVLKVHSDFGTISRQVASGKVMDDVMGVRAGGKVLRDTLFSPDTNRIVFEATPAAHALGLTVEASVFVNKSWTGPQFYCTNLPEQRGRVYRLVVLNAAGAVSTVLRDLDAKAGLITAALDELTKGTRLAVILVNDREEFNPARDILLTATL
ncbi:MAG: hypothetical protein HBSAPP03_10890 [Phycisphaerae bacterium]|nr:MAG: hypothetical protein HBSAPP03_10890 [Phycisphaerae bacterium]